MTLSKPHRKRANAAEAAREARRSWRPRRSPGLRALRSIQGREGLRVRVIDPGHRYALAHLDGDAEEILTFVKREGHGYPGNEGHYPGTNIQEVLRALINRLEYLDNQIPHWRNRDALIHLRSAFEDMEFRAAQRHGRILFQTIEDEPMHLRPFCARCGHVGCQESHGDRPEIPALQTSGRVANNESETAKAEE